MNTSRNRAKGRRRSKSAKSRGLPVCTSATAARSDRSICGDEFTWRMTSPELPSCYNAVKVGCIESQVICATVVSMTWIRQFGTFTSVAPRRSRSRGVVCGEDKRLRQEGQGESKARRGVRGFSKVWAHAHGYSMDALLGGNVGTNLRAFKNTSHTQHQMPFCVKLWVKAQNIVLNLYFIPMFCLWTQQGGFNNSGW